MKARHGGGAFSPGIQEAEAGRLLSLRPAYLQTEFQDSLGNAEKPCLENLKDSLNDYQVSGIH